MNQIVSDPAERERSPWGIRSKVLSLVILSVVLSTALVGTSSYWTARHVLTEKLSEQMVSRAELAAANALEWFQERRHDVRVFASSGIVVETLDIGRHRERMEAYLVEVRERYPIYQGLAVLDAGGSTVAATSEIPSAGVRKMPLTLEWGTPEPTLWVQEPIRRTDGTVAGHFMVLCALDSLRERLVVEASPERLELTSEGRVVLAEPRHPGGKESTATRSVRADVLTTQHTIEIPGLAEPLRVKVQTERRAAFVAVDELRHRIVFLSAAIAALAIAFAYGLVLSLTRPIESLIDGAHAVAHGDYSRRLPVRSGDEIGYLTEVFNRMTKALEESHEKLHRLSTTDELTGLVNRRELREVLARARQTAERTGKPFSLIMIDIDHFKKFNDKHGHVRGDELLTTVGRFLLTSSRATDVASRYGGEEFLLVLPGTGAAEARDRAETLRKEFSRTCAGDARVTLSLGVACWPRDGRTEKEVIDAADRALYSAKRRGRNRVGRAGRRTAQRTSPR